MKQVILLEEAEIARLNKGRQIEISTPSGMTLVIGFDRTLNAKSHATDATCKLCQRSFKNSHGLSIHNLKKHGKGKKQ